VRLESTTSATAAGVDAVDTAKKDSPERIADAAKQFEGLLLAQMLKSMHSSGQGWLGTEDSSTESVMSMAEEQFANMLTAQGGLGLTSMVMKGLHDSVAKPKPAQ
jgi:Rod binding domain-containing protein